MALEIAVDGMNADFDPWEAAGHLRMNLKILIDNYRHHQLCIERALDAEAAPLEPHGIDAARRIALKCRRGWRLQMRRGKSGPLGIGLVAVPALALAQPVANDLSKFNGHLQFTGTYAARLSAGPESAEGVDNAQGEIAWDLEFRDGSVTGAYKPTGLLLPGTVEGSVSGGVCKLYDTRGELDWTGHCSRAGFTGTASTESPFVRNAGTVKFETRLTVAPAKLQNAAKATPAPTRRTEPLAQKQPPSAKPNASNSVVGTAEARRCITFSRSRTTGEIRRSGTYRGESWTLPIDEQTTFVNFECGARPGYSHVRIRLILGMKEGGVCGRADPEDRDFERLAVNFALVDKGLGSLRYSAKSGYFDCILSVQKWEYNNEELIE